MYYLILLFIAILPVAIICIFTYKKDKNKEPIKLLIRLFLSGVLCCFMVLIITEVLKPFISFMDVDESSSFFEIMLHTFLGVALIEEGCKFFMSYINGYKNIEFDEIYDIILYCIVVSCGFAAFENILYVLTSENGLSIGLMRSVLAVPGHAFFALYMGYFLSLAKLASLKGNKELEKKNTILALVIPVILHGIYDFCLMSHLNILLYVFFGFVIALYIISIKKLIYVAKNNISLFPNSRMNDGIKKFCTNCGNPINNNFCTKCGSRQK